MPRESQWPRFEVKHSIPKSHLTCPPNPVCYLLHHIIFVFCIYICTLHSLPHTPLASSLSPGRLRFPKLNRCQTAALPCHLHLPCVSPIIQSLYYMYFSSSPRTNKNPPLLINGNDLSSLFPFHFLLNFSKFLNFPSGFLFLDCLGLDFTQLGNTWFLQSSKLASMEPCCSASFPSLAESFYLGVYSILVS